MRILLTGHDGYLGSVMVPVLKAAGHDVTGLDSRLFAGCTLGAEPESIPAICKDLRDVVAADLAGFAAVVHYGALCNDPLGDVDPALTHAINAEASIRLARLAREAGVRRFLYASSCSLYGAGLGDEVLDEEAKLQPLTPYAESKVRAEEGISGLAGRDFSPVFMRNATAYGASPRFRADIVLNNLMCWAYTTGKARIMSDGTPWRPLVHAADIAAATAALLVAPREAVHDRAFNIGAPDENYQVRDLGSIVCDVVSGATVEYAATAGPDKRDYRVDFTRLARALPDLTFSWTARRGAEEMLEAFRGAGLDTRDFQDGKFNRLTRLKALLAAGEVGPDLRPRGRGGAATT